MPVLPNVPKVCRIDMHFALPNDPNAQFRKFFQYGGVLSTADAQTWITAIAAAYATRMAAIISNQVSENLAVLTDLSSTSAAQAQDSTVRAMTNANPIGGNGTAVIIKDKIARRYRGGHPRTYIPGWPIANMGTAGQWGTAAQALLLTDWNAWIADIIAAVPAAAAPATEVSVSYFQGFTVVTPVGRRAKNVPSLRVGGPVIDAVLSHAVVPVPGSQRRRNETP